MESAQEFLSKKGFRKVHQVNQRYNLTIGELVEFLNEYASNAIKSGSKLFEKRIKPDFQLTDEGQRISRQANS